MTSEREWKDRLYEVSLAAAEAQLEKQLYKARRAKARMELAERSLEIATRHDQKPRAAR